MKWFPQRLAAVLGILVALGSAAAFAQAPPPVPALPDAERRTSYSISGTTCACSVNFALYGSGTDVDAWLEVWVNGARKLSTDPAFGWSLSSATGSLGTIPRPITNAVLTFNSAQTATVQIVGAERPRRLVQFAENRGVAARDLNQAITDIVVQNRETWDKINDVTGRGLFSQPGNTLGLLPLPSQCISAIVGFDATGLNPICINLVSLGALTTPATTVVNELSTWGDTTGHTLRDVTGISAVSGGPLTINPTANTTNSGLVINQSLPPSGSSASELFLNSITISSDNVNNTSAGVFAGFLINYNWGGANAQGPGRAAIFGQSVLNVASPSLGNNGPLGLVGIANATANAGGTNTGAGSAGSVAGANIIGQLSSGATNFSDVNGLEVDTEIFSGASAKSRWGIASVAIGSGSAASGNDAAFVSWAGSGAGGWKNFLFLSNNGTGAPMATTGCLLCTDGTTWTIGTGIDISTGLTITGNAWKSPGWQIDGTGALTGTSANPSSLTSSNTTPLSLVSSSASGFLLTLNDSNAGKTVFVAYEDNATVKWYAGKDTDNAYILNDNALGKTILRAPSNASGEVDFGKQGAVTGLACIIGVTSGSVCQTVAAAVGGTPTITWGSGSGTPAINTTNDTNVTLSLSTTTGMLTAGWTGTLAVARGGIGVGTLTTNGVLYGNSTSAVQATAQGGANTVLTANAGAPSFSASPVIGTSVTTPIYYGGSAAGSSNTIQSTSNGAPSGDTVLIKGTNIILTTISGSTSSLSSSVFTVQGGSNATIVAATGTASTTSTDYYNNPSFFFQNNTNAANNMAAIDFRTASSNSAGAIVMRFVSHTASAAKGRLEFYTACGAAAGNCFGGGAGNRGAVLDEVLHWRVGDGSGIGLTVLPVLTSCGSSPSIIGTDEAGVVTMGTGSPTGCVITFANAYGSAPLCTVTWQATPLASQSYTVSNSAITLTQTATSSNKVNYYCKAIATGWLMKRDLDPAANDNLPAFIKQTA